MWESLTPIIANTLAIIITAIIGWIAAMVQSKFHIELEAKYRDALHSAAMTGVNAALARLNAKPGTLTSDDKLRVIGAAADYMHVSVPDAIAHFSIGEAVLTDIATAKLNMIDVEPKAPLIVTTTKPVTVLPGVKT